MSTRNPLETPADAADGPPFVGALLRLCLERVRARMRAAIRADGFTDIQDHHFGVFSYPPPHGVRPSDLARRLHMTRQATNHLLAQIEQLGYLERRSPDGGDRRLVYVTDRGWRVCETIYRCLRSLQVEWAAEIGAERFAGFMQVLRVLAGPELPQPAPEPPP